MFNKIAHHFWLTNPLDLWTTYHWAIFFLFSPPFIPLSRLSLSHLCPYLSCSLMPPPHPRTGLPPPPLSLRHPPSYVERPRSPLLSMEDVMRLPSSSTLVLVSYAPPPALVGHTPLPVTAHHPQAALLRLMEPRGARGSWGNLVFSSPPTSSSSPHKHGTPSPELIPHFDGAKLFPECVPGVVPELLSNVPSINLQLSWA
jgi:hypothetical protein